MPFRFSAHANRLFVDQGQTEDIAPNGLVATPSRYASTKQVGWDEVSDARCLVLLGDPNIGKSREFAHQHEVLLKDHRRSFLTPWRLWSVGQDLLDVTEGVREAFDSSEEFTWFIDSLDEGRLESANAIGELIELLRAMNRAGKLSALNLRISCRHAEWQLRDTQRLEEIFGGAVELDHDERTEPRVRVVRILSLSEEAVRSLVREALDELGKVNQFLDQCARNGVTSLLGHPVLLATLVDEYSRSARLGTSRTELYEQASSLLAVEVNDTHIELEKLGSSPQARLEAAQDIAARLVLTGRRLIELKQPHPDSDVLTSHATGVEPELLQETLWSALFAAQKRFHYRFFDRTFAEFCAAKRLARGLQAGQPLRSILPLFPTMKGGVPTAMREIAGWLAGMNSNFEDWLIENDISAACYGDTKRYSTANRLKALQHLAAKFQGLRFQDEFSRFGELAYGIDEAEIAKLLEKSNGLAVRSMALEMIAGGNRQDLLHLLLERAVDPDDLHDVRVRAIQVLTGLDAAKHASELKSLLQLDETEDPNDEIAGVVLFNLYPRLLSVDEALSALRVPRKSNHYGRFLTFWSDVIWNSAPLSQHERHRVVEAMTALFDLHGKDASGKRSELNMEAHASAAILRLVLPPLCKEIAHEMKDERADISVVGGWIQKVYSWGHHFGMSGVSVIPLGIKNSEWFKRRLMRWSIAQTPPGEQHYLSEILPFFHESEDEEDVELYFELAVETQADVWVSNQLFNEAARLAFRRRRAGDIDLLTDTSAASKQLTRAWERAKFSDLESPLGRLHRGNAVRRASIDSAQPTPEVDVDVLARLENGDVGEIINACMEVSYDFFADSMIEGLQRRYDAATLDALRKGTSKVWVTFDSVALLWKPPENENGTNLPNEGLAAAVGYLYTQHAPAASPLGTLSTQQAELLVWMALHSNEMPLAALSQAWAAHADVVQNRLASVLQREGNKSQNGIASVWSRITFIVQLPPGLERFLTHWACDNLFPSNTSVRRQMYAYLRRHAGHGALERDVLPKLEQCVEAHANLPTTPPADDNAAMASFALAWRLDTSVIQRHGDNVFGKESHLRRALAFVGALYETVFGEVLSDDWSQGLTTAFFGELIPYLFAADEVTERDGEGRIDGASQLALELRTGLFARVAQGDLDTAIPLFFQWKEDRRFGLWREYLAGQYAKLYRQRLDAQWRPLTDTECAAVIKNTASLVRSKEDVALYLDDIVERKLAPAFRSDSSEVSLLWGKKDDTFRRHNDEKDVQAVVFTQLKTYIKVSPLAGTVSVREPEVFDAKKPDIRFSFVLDDKSQVDVPFEIKWSDHDQVFSAIKNQLLGLYMLDPEVTHGIYLVAWSGLELKEKSPSGVQPATASELAEQLRRLAAGATTGAGKTVSVHVIDASVPAAGAAKKSAKAKATK